MNWSRYKDMSLRCSVVSTSARCQSLLKSAPPDFICRNTSSTLSPVNAANSEAMATAGPIPFGSMTFAQKLDSSSKLNCVDGIDRVRGLRSFDGALELDICDAVIRNILRNREARRVFRIQMELARARIAEVQVEAVVPAREVCLELENDAY